MNRSLVVSSVVLVALGLLVVTPSCSAPEPGTHTARDVPDEPSATAPGSNAGSGPERKPVPLSDRMRSLDKTIYKVTVDDLPAIGSANAPLTVVLFSDYECPFCRKVEPQIAQLRADHGSDVRIVLAPRPLPFHKQAKPAALAVLAAAEQGKLEAMHRALVGLDGKLDDASLTSAAREVGLDLARFDADRRGAKAEKMLEKAEELAKRFSVQGTPTTFVNGQRVTGAVPDVIHQLGEEQLVVGRGLIKGGTPPAKVYETIIANGIASAEPDPSVFVVLKGVANEGKDPSGMVGVTNDQLTEIHRCLGGSTVKPSSTVELTVGADGKVSRVTADSPDAAACLTKASSAWTFKKGNDESRMNLLLKKQ